MTVALTPRQRQYLKALAHPLAPVVQVGTAGVTDSVVTAVDEALERHELIKVKVGKALAADRTDTATDLAKRSGAQICQIIGRVLVLYRRRVHAEPTIRLPTQAA
ncbi:MAG: ribosome assembly RNA-binding protein YhbY [Myxococcales bacterium FL481]|nr:MAG: ribosome assembly RNA-binding protein YhbY [Myxococcales bacterium FL481]